MPRWLRCFYVILGILDAVEVFCGTDSVKKAKSTAECIDRGIIKHLTGFRYRMLLQQVGSGLHFFLVQIFYNGNSHFFFEKLFDIVLAVTKLFFQIVQVNFILVVGINITLDKIYDPRVMSGLFEGIWGIFGNDSIDHIQHIGFAGKAVQILTSCYIVKFFEEFFLIADFHKWR